MAKAENENRHDPIQLAWMVKEVSWLYRALALAGQPDSPSRQAGWGLRFFALVASFPTSFTIRASRMGSWEGFFGTTSAVPQAILACPFRLGTWLQGQ
jgi:hypothetical protein